MKAFTFVVVAITMALGVNAGVNADARACLPKGSNQCDLSGKHNCCSGFCDKPKDWAKGICK